MVDTARNMTRFIWDVDYEVTEEIYQDIGVKELELGAGGKTLPESRQHSLKVCEDHSTVLYDKLPP